MVGRDRVVAVTGATGRQGGAARVGWAAKFGQPDPGFDGVRLQILQTLGGYDAEGSTEFTLDALD